MYKVTFIKCIFDAATDDPEATFAAFSRQLELPFVPSLGLGIFFGLEKPQVINAVAWDVEQSSFTCNVPDEFPDNLSLDGMTFAQMVDEAKANGWTLVKLYQRT